MIKEQNDLDDEVWVRHSLGIMVSNMGRVETKIKGKNYGYGRGNGYLAVKWKGKVYQVHRLICEAFHDNPDNLPTVDHINRDKTDNRADNLRWADYSMQNKNREVDYKAIASKIDYKAITAKIDYKVIAEKNAEKFSIPILQLNKNMEIVKEWKSAMEAQRDCGYEQSGINHCLKGRCKSAYGYVWRYKNGEAC